MGNQLLMFGDIRATGLQLYREGIIVMVPGEIQIGRSTDLRVKVSSHLLGQFHVQLKYLGGAIADIDIDHEELLELLHGSEIEERYQILLEKYCYSRQNMTIRLARGVHVDVTKFLPYLYERFAYQDLAEIAERLVQERQLAKLQAPQHSRFARKLLEDQPTQKPSSNLSELEDLEKSLQLALDSFS